MEKLENHITKYFWEYDEESIESQAFQKKRQHVAKLFPCSQRGSQMFEHILSADRLTLLN